MTETLVDIISSMREVPSATELKYNQAISGRDLALKASELQYNDSLSVLELHVAPPSAAIARTSSFLGF